MQNQQFPTIKPAQRQQKTSNPILNFLESDLPQIQSTKTEIIDLSGFNTQIDSKYTGQENLNTIVQNLGKNDGYTDMRGIAPARQHISSDINTLYQQNLTENDIFLSFGLESSLWLLIGTLIEKGDKMYIPKIVDPFIISQINSFEGDYQQYDKLEDIKNDFQSIIIYNPQFLQKNQYVSDEQAQLLLKKVQENQKALIVIGDISVFLRNNKDIQAHLIWVQELNDNCKGWKASYSVLFGSGFDDVKKGLTNLSNVILMQNTVMQSSFIDLYENNKKNKIDPKLEEFQEIFKNQNFYIYKNLGVILLKVDNDQEFCKKLYTDHGIKCLPGSFFGLQQPSIVFTLLSQSQDYKTLNGILQSQ